MSKLKEHLGTDFVPSAEGFAEALTLAGRKNESVVESYNAETDQVRMRFFSKSKSPESLYAMLYPFAEFPEMKHDVMIVSGDMLKSVLLFLDKDKSKEDTSPSATAAEPIPTAIVETKKKPLDTTLDEKGDIIRDLILKAELSPFRLAFVNKNENWFSFTAPPTHKIHPAMLEVLSKYHNGAKTQSLSGIQYFRVDAKNIAPIIHTLEGLAPSQKANIETEKTSTEAAAPCVPFVPEDPRYDLTPIMQPKKIGIRDVKNGESFAVTALRSMAILGEIGKVSKGPGVKVIIKLHGDDKIPIKEGAVTMPQRFSEPMLAIAEKGSSITHGIILSLDHGTQPLMNAINRYFQTMPQDVRDTVMSKLRESIRDNPTRAGGI